MERWKARVLLLTGLFGASTSNYRILNFTSTAEHGPLPRGKLQTHHSIFAIQEVVETPIVPYFNRHALSTDLLHRNWFCYWIAKSYEGTLVQPPRSMPSIKKRRYENFQVRYGQDQQQVFELITPLVVAEIKEDNWSGCSLEFHNGRRDRVRVLSPF